MGVSERCDATLSGKGKQHTGVRRESIWTRVAGEAAERHCKDMTQSTTEADCSCWSLYGNKINVIGTWSWYLGLWHQNERILRNTRDTRVHVGQRNYTFMHGQKREIIV